ncbi:glycosyltransferase [Metabacillus indicus]|uniref:Glycosyl transferase family 1 n=1 Tax=Metabacillus indicus TaxID=246786 RepID=A0A084H4H1_METID|nr:glycosyltransferase [Metabacillus indicus]KEZ50327.1 glycosyl transferase family 1 [Metabacillus indicus LMG 22858]KEZ54483.1 glycosyl transferase family 1 [Metabacillus indicus]
MKKNLLFVIPGLDAGGGEKSLINLLTLIDYEKVNVDLLLFNHDGIFMRYLPNQVNVLPLPETFRVFALPAHKSIIKFMFKREFDMVYNRILFAFRNKLSGNVSKNEQYSWKYVSKSFQVLDKEYDSAIGFLEKTSTYFCVEKVNANKKIGWVHIDYNKLGMDPEYDMEYFNKLDHIVTVSEECSVILKENFPSHKDKIDVIYNIVSPRVIYNMAVQNTEKTTLGSNNKEISILTIGRLHPQKGYDLAIEACQLLCKKRINVKWHVIGEGEERKKLVKMIKNKKLQDNFILHGLEPNPYPFIKRADIYVQTSKFEGKSIAIDEAKILRKPIIVTDFSTAKDQIIDGVDGMIVDMDAKSIAAGIEKLIHDKELRNMLIHNLSEKNLGTEDEISKFYRLIGT